MKRIQSSSFKKIANDSPHGGPCMKCGKDLPVVWGPSMCAECGKKHDEEIKKHKESKDKQPPMTPKMAQMEQTTPGQQRPGGKISDRSLEAIPSNLQSIGQTIHSVLDQNIKQQLNKVFVPFNQQVMSIINKAKSQGAGFSPNYQARPETANQFVPQKMAQSFGQPQSSPTVMKLKQIKQLLDEIGGEMHAETDEAAREEMSNWIMELRRTLDHMI